MCRKVTVTYREVVVEPTATFEAATALPLMARVPLAVVSKVPLLTVTTTEVASVASVLMTPEAVPCTTAWPAVTVVGQSSASPQPDCGVCRGDLDVLDDAVRQSLEGRLDVLGDAVSEEVDGSCGKLRRARW